MVKDIKANKLVHAPHTKPLALRVRKQDLGGHSYKMMPTPRALGAKMIDNKRLKFVGPIQD